MNEDFWLIVPVAAVWAVLAFAYAVAPWGDMIGYAWVWGFGSLLFVGLAALLARGVQHGGADGGSESSSPERRA